MDKKDIAKRLEELKLESTHGFNQPVYIIPAESLENLIEELKSESEQEDLMDTSEADLP